MCNRIYTEIKLPYNQYFNFKFLSMNCNLKIKALCSAFMLVAASYSFAATKFTIPTAEGDYIDLSLADVENANVEGSAGPDQCFGSTGEETLVTFSFENTVAQPYTFVMSTGHKGTCVINATLKDASGTTVLTEKFDVPNTGSWGRSTNHKMIISDALPVGDYTLELKPSDLKDSGYAGNWGKMAFYAGVVDSRDHIPGDISLGKGNYIGMRTENNDGNVGYVKDATYGSYELVCDESGVYDLSWGISRYGDGVATITVTDKEGNESVNTKWTVGDQKDYAPVTVHLEGEVAKGDNILKILFNANHTGFIVNFNNLKMTRVADHYACIRNVAVEGYTVTEGDGYDLNCNLPISFNGSNVSFTMEHPNCSVAVTAKKGDDAVAVTEAGGKYTIAAPDANEEVIVTMEITPDEGDVVAYKTVYTMRIFHIGEIILDELTIDGTPASEELFAAITAEPYETTLNNIFTHLPVIRAKFVHGQEVIATPGELDGTKVEYTIVASVDDKSRTYKLNIDGIHLYDVLDTDETVSLLFNEGTFNDETKEWTNGQFSLSGIDGGWNGEFKFPITAEKTYTLGVGPDAVVKQLIFKGLRDNYTKNTNIISEVKSGDAIVWIPSDNRFYNTSEAGDRDLVINIEGHKVGSPIEFTVVSNGQLMSKFDLTVGREAITSAPVMISAETIVPDNANHFVVKTKFDRVIASAKAKVGDKEVVAVGGSDVIYFPVWNLDYSKEYEVVIAEAVDNYGNHMSQSATVKASTGAKAEVVKTGIDYVVGNVDEFKAALAAVNESNASADAAAVVIFVKNGDYDFGGEEQTFRCHNVAIIGESREGVILHGNRSGISNPVISTRYSYNTYLQDLTLRNDYDWGKPRVGVGVALSSGTREVGVNLSLESQQDTQVTNGNQCYYLDCDFYGAVDYVCGGGDQFYDNCNFLMTADGTIAAPSTAKDCKWGYVFSGCTVDEAAPGALVKGWYLSRPWQNEPRTYWINTVMKVKPVDVGYNSMGNLPTHFYEFGSVDADGNLLDLSVRGNSPTHVGAPYEPVLTAEEAAHYTVGNVLGMTDSYSAEEVVKTPEVPAVTIDGDNLKWNADADARFYVVYLDGAYVGNTIENTFAIDGKGIYTVRAANARGGLSAYSERVPVGVVGIDAVEGASDIVSVEYFNLQGVRVSESATGICIKVTVYGDGHKSVEKVVK